MRVEPQNRQPSGANRLEVIVLHDEGPVRVAGQLNEFVKPKSLSRNEKTSTS